MHAVERIPRLAASDLGVTLVGDEGDLRVLDGVALDVAAGEIVDVIGPSGAGKSTLLRALARLMPTATGSLVLDGTPAEQIAPQRWRAKVALVPQKPAIVPGSVRYNLLLPWEFKVRAGEAVPEDARLAAILAEFGLEAVSLDRDAARLSVGQQARVALLRVILSEPAVLLLDEPDANLDDASAEQVAHATAEFARNGGGVVRVRHQRVDALAARRLRLSSGHLLEVVT